MLEWCWSGLESVGVDWRVLEWLGIAWNSVRVELEQLGMCWSVLEWCWSGMEGVGMAWNGVGVELKWRGLE